MKMEISLVIALLVQFIRSTLSVAVIDLEDTVEGGTFHYYNLSIDHAAVLQIFSLSGDCDLYVSQDVSRPTYKDYSLHSATCGVDSVFIPKRFKRPVHVGIYGHPYHEASQCLINICIVDNNDELEELLEITASTSEDSCSKTLEPVKERAFIIRGFRILIDFLASVQFEGVLFDIATALVQVII